MEVIGTVCTVIVAGEVLIAATAVILALSMLDSVAEMLRMSRDQLEAWVISHRPRYTVIH